MSSKCIRPKDWMGGGVAEWVPWCRTAGQDDFFSMSGSLMEGRTGVRSGAAPVGTSAPSIIAQAARKKK
jgi:hypothetical protein